jgi:hypothetical protein
MFEPPENAAFSALKRQFASTLDAEKLLSDTFFYQDFVN